MCNPPFFGSVEEKGENPQTVCTATSNELATEGGELEFVGHIIRDSLELRHQVRWYSSMIGRKVNVAPLLKMLHDHHVHNIRQTTFYQGRTTRWAIAWSFSNDGFYQIQVRPYSYGCHCNFFLLEGSSTRVKYDQKVRRLYSTQRAKQSGAKDHSTSAGE
jgi:23S rRNA A1618 N6-methylase RlmF